MKLPMQYIFVLILLATMPCIHAQPLYGNEWINHNQTYVRIPIVKTGFYKLPFSQLSKLGIDPDTLVDIHFQLFRNGRQIPIGLTYNPKKITNSFITFYAERNDGRNDTTLYVSPDLLPHTFYNLYSDTASYYLTWNAKGDNKRIPLKSQGTHQAKITTTYIEEELQLFNSFYATGKFYPPGSNFQTGLVLSAYDVGEGWTGPMLTLQDAGHFQVKLKEAESAKIGDCHTQVYLQGRDAGNHEFEIWVIKDGVQYRKLATYSILNYNNLILQLNFLPTDIQSDQTVHIDVLPVNNKAKFSVSAIAWKYPRLFKKDTTALQKIFFLDATYIGKIWKNISNPNHDFYDCTDPFAIEKFEHPQDGFRIDKPLRLLEVKEYFTAQNLQLLHFTPIYPTKVDYLIITHPTLRVAAKDPVQAYANYRASKIGGGYTPFIIYSQDIFNQFNYGQPGPNGIRNIIRWLHDQGNLKFVLLIGTSLDPQKSRRLPAYLDMIPNAGWPGSDLALAMPIGLTADDFIPRVPVGRIHAQNPDQVFTYLQKVMAMESTASTSRWRKNILHLSGGSTPSERTLFKTYTQTFAAQIQQTSLAPSITTLSKTNDDPIEQIPIHKYLNEGLALITMFGHSGLESTDLNIGYASDSSHISPHTPYFPAVIVNGCATGSIFYSNSTISSDWIFAPKSGAVLFLAHTFNGASSYLKRYTASIYDVLADPDFQSKPFGLIQQEAIKRNLSNHFSIGDAIHAQQMNLQGDPAIRIFPATMPDYRFDTTYFKQIQPVSAHADSISFEIVIQNNGRAYDDTLSLLLSRRIRGELLQIHTFHCPKITYADTLIFRIPRQNPLYEPESWELKLDPDNVILEEEKDNNTFHLDFIPFISEAIPILPLHGAYRPSFPISLVAQIPLERIGEIVNFEWADNPLFASAQKQSLLTKETIIHANLIHQTSDTLFWRVYLQQDAANRAEKRVLFIQKEPAFTAVPEVVLLQSEQIKHTFLEGEEYNALIQFQNITPVSFRDSIQIKIQHRYNNSETVDYEWIKPILGLEKRIFQYKRSTTGQAGTHALTFFFNHTQLPEAIYDNNQYHVLYQVYKDRVAPVLLVYIDGQQRMDFETVAPNPHIEIIFQDENRFQIKKDTTNLHVYLQKICEACPMERISLKNATYTFDDSNQFRLHLPIEKPLPEGQYLLTVDAMDLSRNKAQTHRSRFQVISTPNLQVLVSPNPARNWFRFQIDAQGTAPGVGLIQIWNQKGHLVKQITNFFKTGRNEVFWNPSPLPAGIYLYQLTWPNTSNQLPQSIFKGKMIWIP